MIKRIELHELCVGMYIHRLDASWINHPFWRESFFVKTAEELSRVRASGVPAVWIDTERGLAPLTAPDDTPAPQADAPSDALADVAAARRRAATSIQDELGGAATVCRAAREAITSVFEEARMGLLGDSRVAREVVEEIGDSIIRNPGALVSLARLKTADTYTYMHSVAVCALMVSLARQLELDEAQTRCAGIAGLLHDIGKAKVPMSLLNKPGRLTQDEFIVVQSHPVHGHRMLQAIGDVEAEAVDACLHHHEKMDGTGYPHRLPGSEIGLIARMTAICDVYDAVTSDRPYKKAWDPADALRRMAEWSGTHFDPRLFQAFVRSIGIYPVGSLVRLSSGRLAVVMEQSDALVAPRVKVFYSTKSQMRVLPEVLDLAQMVNEKIVAREDPDYWRFTDLTELWTGIVS
jgi:putative nucleotidyltransferase with HDIG domain